MASLSILKMYGLLLEGIRQYICSKYGEEQWNSILKWSEIDHATFGIHEIYSESMIPRIIDAASRYLNMTVEEVMFENGGFFINFLAQYGYDGVLRVLGRDLRDFLNGLDNLHEYLRFSYPKMKPPSFFCVNESKTGITLQYRTKRYGYNHYVRGQITEIAKQFYKTKMNIELVSETETDGVYNCIMRLHFNNVSYVAKQDNLPVPSEVFFEVFPFNIVFNRGMKIINVGQGMQNALDSLIGLLVNEKFVLSRPLIKFDWDSVMLHTNNIFEIAARKECKQLPNCKRDKAKGKQNSTDEFVIRLRGQMKYMLDWDAIVFLGTPMMRDVNNMWQAGLYINDLSMHDSSRDLVLAGEQQSAELKLALDQEHEKSRKLEDSLKRLDEEMKRTDDLLYQMIPRAVAERLRQGEDSISTCETFNEVTILFSDVVGFTNICSQISPLDVVNMLNSMYSVFDKLTEKHKVYKVETIGDAYMIVSGCPVITDLHGPLIVEMAMDMVKEIQSIRDPSHGGSHLRIRVGVHTGTCVAGVVGIKMPRYCLFGDTVNTASRMESNSEPQKIHISETTRERIDRFDIYTVSNRGSIEVKGKGLMKTYWLQSRDDESNPSVKTFLNTLDKEREKLQGAMSSGQSTAETWEKLSQSRCSSGVSRVSSDRRASTSYGLHLGAPDSSMNREPIEIRPTKQRPKVSR